MTETTEYVSRKARRHAAQAEARARIAIPVEELPAPEAEQVVEPRYTLPEPVWESPEQVPEAPSEDFSETVAESIDTAWEMSEEPLEPIRAPKRSAIKSTRKRRAKKRVRHKAKPDEVARSFLIAVLVILLCVFSVSTLLSDSARDLPISAFRPVYETRIKAMGLREMDANRLIRNLGIDPDTPDEWLYYASDSLMEVSELLILKSSDSDVLETAKDKVNARLSAQKTSFNGYGTNQTELLNNATVRTIGKYLFYGVSPQIDQWEEEFLSCVK